jgi:phytanoyl-CoA hydroxylase
MKQFEYPYFSLSDQLTHEQISFFDKYGFIHFKNFVNEDTVQLLINASLDVQEKFLQEDLKKVNGVPIKYGYDVDGSKIVQRFAFTSLFSPVLHEFLLDPRFRSLFPLLGGGSDPRIGENEKDGMVFNHYINTENSKFTKLGWHTDCLRDIFYGKKVMPMLNVGIHLSNAVKGNGGLRIIPGSHKQNLFNLLFRKKYFIDNKPDKEEIGLAPKAGDLTVHDGRLWHRVAQSTIRGEESRRRVIYIPLLCGTYEPKDEASPTLFYQRFSNLIK